MMLDDVERSLISIKHRLQHHPTFLLFLSVNNNVAFVWPPCSTLLNARMPAKLTLRVSVSIAHCRNVRALGPFSYIDYIENLNISAEMFMNEKLPHQV